MRTEKDICTTCYSIQDACNFVPVCRELVTTIEDLKKIGIEHQNLSKHPAVIILVDKINDLMKRPCHQELMDAFRYCREMTEQNKPAPVIEVQ